MRKQFKLPGFYEFYGQQVGDKYNAILYDEYGIVNIESLIEDWNGKLLTYEELVELHSLIKEVLM